MQVGTGVPSPSQEGEGPEMLTNRPREPQLVNSGAGSSFRSDGLSTARRLLQGSEPNKCPTRSRSCFAWISAESGTPDTFLFLRFLWLLGGRLTPLRAQRHLTLDEIVPPRVASRLHIWSWHWQQEAGRSVALPCDKYRAAVLKTRTRD